MTTVKKYLVRKRWYAGSLAASSPRETDGRMRPSLFLWEEASSGQARPKRTDRFLAQWTPQHRTSPWRLPPPRRRASATSGPTQTFPTRTRLPRRGTPVSPPVSSFARAPRAASDRPTDSALHPTILARRPGGLALLRSRSPCQADCAFLLFPAAVVLKQMSIMRALLAKGARHGPGALTLRQGPPSRGQRKGRPPRAFPACASPPESTATLRLRRPLHPRMAT